jgi:hypothetical protein
MPRELINKEKECIIDVIDDYKVLRMIGDSFKVSNILYKEEAEVISSRDLAHVIMKEGAEGIFFKSPGFSREMILYNNKHDPIIFSNSLFLSFYKSSLEQSEFDNRYTNKNINEPQISRSQKNSITEYLRSPETFKRFYDSAIQEKNKEPDMKYSLILRKDISKKIPTNRLSQEELGLFHYKDLANDFGNFLNENKIEFINFSINSAEASPFNSNIFLDKSFYRHCFHRAGESQDIDYNNCRFENFYFGISKK